MEGDVYGASHTNENGDTYEIADQTVSFGYEDYMIKNFNINETITSAEFAERREQDRIRVAMEHDEAFGAIRRAHSRRPEEPLGNSML